MQTFDPTYVAVRAIVDRNRRSLANHRQVIDHAQEHVASSRALMGHHGRPVGTPFRHIRPHAYPSQRGALLVESLGDFNRSLRAADDDAHVLVHVVERITEALRIAGACFRVTGEEGLRIIAAGEASVGALEDFQSETGLGPAATAVEDRRIVRVFDIAQDENRTAWPRFAERATALGIVSLACIPVSIDAGAPGSLDLYDSRPQLWTQAQLSFATAVVELAAARIDELSERGSLLRLTRQLQEALDSRVVIEQAKGVLAGVHRVSVDDAFGLLRGYARSHSLRLHDVATDVVERRLNLGIGP